MNESTYKMTGFPIIELEPVKSVAQPPEDLDAEDPAKVDC